MEKIPILKLGDFLLVTIQVDMHDRLALALQDDLSARVVSRSETIHRHLLIVVTVCVEDNVLRP